MKIPLVVALVSAGMCISLPTLAQDQKAIDAAVRKQIEAVLTEFRVAYNRHDAAAVAALYTPDAVEFRSWRGLLSGQEAIRSSFQLDFATSDLTGPCFGEPFNPLMLGLVIQQQD